ncbi:MAG: ABC transporter permease [Armatimonadetes bacterium]|nr:ABC transporter permease [Armatimonadota bacterium]
MLLILTSLLVIGVSLAVPLLLAALGELIVEKAGVINVGIEGMVLAGALAGFTASHAAHSPWLGALAALLAGVALASLLAALSVGVGADQVVVGTAINILSLGLTGVFFRALFGGPGALAAPFVPLPLAGLHRLPLVGPALFEQNALGYVAWALVPLCAFYLRRTRAGLRLRAVGEYPAAADGAGVPVARVRVLAVLWGGGLAGLAGAYLSIGYTNGFAENMSAGRGFIALAVVILGHWTPGGIALAALLFGLADALHYQLLSAGGRAGFLSRLPYQLLQALPYLLTLLALLFRSRLKSSPPAALGEAYQRS